MSRPTQVTDAVRDIIPSEGGAAGVEATHGSDETGTYLHHAAEISDAACKLSPRSELGRRAFHVPLPADTTITSGQLTAR